MSYSPKRVLNNFNILSFLVLDFNTYGDKFSPLFKTANSFI